MTLLQEEPSYTRVSWGEPFLRWAGGKRALLPALLKMVPKSFKTYREPFLGGGALFFALQPPVALINDINSDLMDTYMAVRDMPEELIAALRRMQKTYRLLGETYYYRVRNGDLGGPVKLRTAAKFIFLNKTCFNGLYRVNRAGSFNVPHGKFKTPPTICDAETIRAASSALQTFAGRGQRARRTCLLAQWDFGKVFAGACEGDFIYADPPYAPLSDTSDFTAYAKTGFPPDYHERLRNEASAAAKRGARVLVSNSSAPLIRKLYSDRKAFDIVEVEVKRHINSKGDGRGVVKELLIRTKGRW